MFLKIRIRSKARPEPAIAKIPGYRIRPTSFVASLGVHFLLVVLLALIPTLEDSAPKKPVYETLIRPESHKIVWYNFRKPEPVPKKLPDVSSTARVGRFPKPRGRELSKDVLIATAPKAVSRKQFIWQPVPKLEIKQDLPAPNLIARTSMSVPAPPPDARKKPERPDLEGARAAQPNTSPPAPNADPNHAQESPADGVQAMKVRKAFIPPPPVTREARLPTPVPTIESPSPDPSILGTPKMQIALPQGVGAPALSAGAAPPSNAPPGPVASTGNAKVDIAIASLDPAAKLNGPLPDGSRPGSFSKAPIRGEPATGPVNGSGLKVPNLTIREDRSKSIQTPPALNDGRRTVLYSEKVRSVPVSTLSVPLRPASRSIPRTIDARFQGRYVYTMVVPIENLPEYAGDWILWFAEREQKPGENPLMRAPVPLRKLELVETMSPASPVERRLQVAATIKKDGTLDSIAPLRSASAGVDQAMIQDLASWQFKPATRDGIAVDVDVVIEIPFNLSSEVARRAQP